ncbi:hypothetical protein [Marinoscillum pacificum]|uniref:hypothetical protein n=1 Tax=Marinoscillum pacificum TaxID=392723 RepID=UPI002157558E|nr:hypothetical protein [Marinoscillum pacificum]
MTNLLMGFAHGYDIGDLEVFIKSLKAHGFSGEAVLFTNKINTTKRKEIYQTYSVTCIDSKDPVFKKTLKDQPIIDQLLPAIRRYLIYESYLNSGQEYGNVFISDTRDVLFQGNLDDYEVKDELHVFLERDNNSIVENSFNRNWILNGYGEEGLALIGNKTISCSGFTFGSHKQMANYLKLMSDEIVKFHNTQPKIIGGIDQGFHNYLVHTNKIDNCIIHPNKTFGVITCGRESNLKLKDGIILDDNECVQTIVHQYDRNTDIYKELNPYRYNKEQEIKRKRESKSFWSRLFN